MARPYKFLPVFLLLGWFSHCDCDDASRIPCVIDTDCPDGMYCQDGFCVPLSDKDGGEDGDGGTRPDYGWDGGGLPPCNTQDDCIGDEVCFNGKCVVVVPNPDCVEGDSDDCENDTYCEPSLDGCISWEAHPYPLPDCEYIPPPGEFTPTEEWIWENPVEKPEWDEVMMTPIVVDLTGEMGGDPFVIPAVVFNTFRKDLEYEQDGVLRAVEGHTGKPIFSVTDPEYYTHPVSGIAAGDIDGDGRAELVTGKNGGRDLICFEDDGTFKWATDTDSLAVGWGCPAIANIDGEGDPEIVMGAAVINADGSVRWHKSGPRGDNYTAGPAPFSVPADVDNDGFMEIVTGSKLYAHDGSEIWSTSYGDGFVAVADISGHADQLPEIVVVNNGNVRVQSSTNGEPLWTRTAQWLIDNVDECDPDCGLLGPPTVADFDGDGRPEIGVAGADVYIVFTGGGDILWHVPSQDSSSNVTGSAVFDFEGDHRAEVVYADEVSLKVLKGSDGSVLYQQPHSSLTACEYPVIADVDSDHNAEIVIAQNTLIDSAPQKFKGIRVFGDAKDNWVDTRAIWNQHAYHVTNVNENGTIPQDAQQNWKVDGLNNFRQNVQGQGLFDAPDLTALGLGFDPAKCRTEGIWIRAAVFNRGQQEVAPGVPVSFYRGDPRSGGVLLGTEHTTIPLSPGEHEVISFLFADPPQDQYFDIYVVADDEGWNNGPSGRNNECREQNNLGYIKDVICKSET